MGNPTKQMKSKDFFLGNKKKEVLRSLQNLVTI